jgi:type II secretory pathway pseudopilin PulG
VHKKAVTLIEILLVIILSALLMAAIIPFIRSVSSTWEVGSSKQEILQNGRAALEMMTRYIRQARRITQIPSSSQIKIRDQEDKFDITFYYDSGQKNLMMRSNQAGSDVDSLLAPGVDSLTFGFLQDNGAPATRANQVKSVQMQMVLSDPLSSTSYTLALEDTVVWRKDVRESIWAINDGDDKLTNIAYWTVASGFNITNAASNCISTNPQDFSCWVADRTGNTTAYVKRVSSSGQVEWTVTGFNQPRAVSVNSNPNLSVNGKETVWVANTNAGSVLRLVWWTASNTWTSSTAAGGANLTGFATPSSVSVNSDWTVNGKETCWVAEATTARRVRRIYWTGTTWTSESITGTVAAFNTPRSVSVNPNERYYNKETCWVAYTGGDRVRKIYATSSTAWTYVLSPVVFSGPRSVSVNPNTGECWVADTGNDRIVKLSSPGSLLWNSATNVFSSPYSVSVNSADDTCWVADYGHNRVVRLGADGSIEWSIGGFNKP